MRPQGKAVAEGWRAIWRHKRKLAWAQVALVAPAHSLANRGRKRSLVVAATVTERRAVAGAGGGKGGANRELRAGGSETQR